MIPVVVRSTEELLRSCPNELREASYALGVPKWRTILQGSSCRPPMSGIVTGVILAIARIIGETAPCSWSRPGFTQSINMNFFSGPMMTLPTFVYDQYAYRGIPPEAFVDRAWAGALTLILIVMALNLIGRIIAEAVRPEAPAANAQGDRNAPMSKRIEVQDLDIYYGDFKAVEGRLHGHRAPRAVTAFIGPSGCGKSTFLRTLNRMHEVIPGAASRARGAARRRGPLRPGVDPVNVRRQVGMVFQRPNPFPTMSIRRTCSPASS
jgi:ABC-type multidrug transport system fused ATPase/permease subunit